jgi:hypothetical protein
MKPIKFEVNSSEYAAPAVTCKNWYGKEVKFYFDMNNANWINSSNFKKVEQGSSFSQKLCFYAELQMRLILEQKRKELTQ